MGSSNGASQSAVTLGESAGPAFGIHQPVRRRKGMSYIYNFFDNHMEISGAIVFGIVAVGACVAMAAALAGAL